MYCFTQCREATFWTVLTLLTYWDRCDLDSNKSNRHSSPSRRAPDCRQTFETKHLTYWRRRELMMTTKSKFLRHLLGSKVVEWTFHRNRDLACVTRMRTTCRTILQRLTSMSTAVINWPHFHFPLGWDLLQWSPGIKSPISLASSKRLIDFIICTYNPWSSKGSKISICS